LSRSTRKFYPMDDLGGGGGMGCPKSLGTAFGETEEGGGGGLLGGEQCTGGEWFCKTKNNDGRGGGCGLAIGEGTKLRLDPGFPSQDAG